MELAAILIEIDSQIARLKAARAILVGNTSGNISNGIRKSGRKKRNLTPEGRRAISEAVKRRWAAQKKAGAGK